MKHLCHCQDRFKATLKPNYLRIELLWLIQKGWLTLTMTIRRRFDFRNLWTASFTGNSGGDFKVRSSASTMVSFSSLTFTQKKCQKKRNGDLAHPHEFSLDDGPVSRLLMSYFPCPIRSIKIFPASTHIKNLQIDLCTPSMFHWTWW